MSSFQTLLPESSVLTAEQAEHECGMPVNQLQKTVAIQPKNMNRRDCTGCSAVKCVVSYEVFIEKDFSIAIAEAVTTTSRELHQSTRNRVESIHRVTALKQDASCRQQQQINIAMLSDLLNSGRHGCGDRQRKRKEDSVS